MACLSRTQMYVTRVTIRLDNSCMKQDSVYRKAMHTRLSLVIPLFHRLLCLPILRINECLRRRECRLSTRGEVGNLGPKRPASTPRQGLRSLNKISAGTHTATLPCYIYKLDTFSYNNQLSGAAEARRAHNPEDLGSKPSLAMFLEISFWYLSK